MGWAETTAGWRFRLGWPCWHCEPSVPLRASCLCSSQRLTHTLKTSGFGWPRDISQHFSNIVHPINPCWSFSCSSVLRSFGYVNAVSHVTGLVLGRSASRQIAFTSTYSNLSAFISAGFKLQNVFITGFWPRISSIYTGSAGSFLRKATSWAPAAAVWICTFCHRTGVLLPSFLSAPQLADTAGGEARPSSFPFALHTWRRTETPTHPSSGYRART